ncbi:MAG: hypothetical protein HYT87_16985 [Nitrospirae bacterium]|nr:hypothetical protein [Nitrospirota bacterium]
MAISFQRSAVSFGVGLVALLLLGGVEANAQLLDPPEGKVHWRQEAASGPPLSDVTQIIAAEDLAEPKWAPGMRYIGVTRKNRRGLWVIRLTDGKVLRISPAYGSGRDYAFSFDGTKIIFNIREPKDMAALHDGPPHWTFMIVDLDKERIDYRGPVEKGFLHLSWFRPTEFQTVVRYDRTLEVRHYMSSDRVPAFEKGRMQRWGVVGVTEAAGTLWKMRADHTRRGYRFELPPDLLNPNLSHNQRVIAAQSDEGRAYLIGTATDFVVDLGEGQNVRWGWWYDKAVFERVQKAGDEVVSSEIILADLKKLKSYNLTQTPGVIERYPDLSLNQKWVTYVSPEGLFVGRVPPLEGKK